MLSKQRAVQGSRLGSQTRRVINNVHAFFSAKKWAHPNEPAGNSRLNVVRETSDATGVSERTVHTIAKEGTTRGGFASPERKMPATERAPTHRVTVIDGFDICAMRIIIHRKYLQGEKVTLDTLKAALLDEMDMNVGRSTIRRRLLQTAFSSGRSTIGRF